MGAHRIPNLRLTARAPGPPHAAAPRTDVLDPAASALLQDDRQLHVVPYMLTHIHQTTTSGANLLLLHVILLFQSGINNTTFERLEPEPIAELD